MNTEQVIRLYWTGIDFPLYRNQELIGRYRHARYAFRIAKQVFDATKKLSTAPVFFEDNTSFVSEV